MDSVSKHEMIFQFRFRRDALLCLVAGPTQGHLETIRDLENKALRAIHISGFNLQSLTHITVDGIEAIEVVYDGPPNLKSKKVGFVNDGIEFIITAEVLSSKFEEYKPILDACIQSFRFEKRLLGFFEKRIIDQ